MISFIDEYRSVLGVEPICRLLPIAPSTYYEVVAKRTDVGRLSARARRDMAMKIEIRRVFNENYQVYGVRKVWRQLQREGFDVARCTVARLMRVMGLQGIIRGKPVKTTVSDKAAPCPLDRVNRQFCAPAPNMLWLSDFTYVATWQGFVYVAFVIDAFARRIVGWRASRTAHAGFVLDALDQAVHDRRPVKRGGLIHHSDRGVQYVSIKYSERLAEAGIEPSVGSVGDSYDNALAETINGLYKAEVIHRRGPWRTSKPWSSPRWNGWIGSTAAAFWNPSETFRQPKPNNATTPCWTKQPWPHNLNQTVSGKSGAVQPDKLTMPRKCHILVDTLGMLLKAEVHSAGVQERDGAGLVFDKFAGRFPFIETIFGDGGYQGPKIQAASPRPMEIVKRNQAGFEVLPKRWIVERTLAWLGINRRLARDFERFSTTSIAFIHAAMIKLMTRRLARYPLS